MKRETDRPIEYSADDSRRRLTFLRPALACLSAIVLGGTLPAGGQEASGGTAGGTASGTAEDVHILPPVPTFTSGPGISPSKTSIDNPPRIKGQPISQGSRFVIPNVNDLPWMQGVAPGTRSNFTAVPKFSPEFWKGQMNNRVPIGTVLTGILESDVSSRQSQTGDIFTIRLEDGYFSGSKEIVPRNSKIVGAVVAASPAKFMTHGHPGSLKVSLQTLVFPDGRNTPIYGHLDHNPNMDLIDDPRDSQLASSLSYYPRATAASLARVGKTLSGRLIGIRPGIRSRGLDFKLSEGEVMAIKLNRSLDLNNMSPPPTAYIPPGTPLPGGVSIPLRQAPGYVQQPSSAAYQSSPVTPLIPGARQIPGAQQIQSTRQVQAPPLNSPASSSMTPADANPNKIFESPLGASPKIDMPEPF